jgi:hypothetical protein
MNLGRVGRSFSPTVFIGHRWTVETPDETSLSPSCRVSPGLSSFPHFERNPTTHNPYPLRPGTPLMGKNQSERGEGVSAGGFVPN